MHHRKLFGLALSSLAISLFSAHAADPAPERITYSMDWWVGAQGEVTKIYDVRYEGEATRKRLARFAKVFASESAFVEKLLPNKSARDELVRHESPAPGHFVWIFKSEAQNVAPHSKPSLVLRVPVIEDPVAQIWTPESGSRTRYRFQNLEIRNRLGFRGPWKFEGDLTHKNHVFSEDGLELKLTAKRLSDKDGSDRKYPGWDLPGAEISQTLIAQDRVIERAEIERFQEKHGEWLPYRFFGGALVGYPESTSSVPTISSFRWGGGTELGYQGMRINERDYHAFDFGFAVSLERRFSRHLAWQALRGSFAYVSGQSPDVPTSSRAQFRNFRFTLGSQGQLRWPFFTGTSENRNLSFVEIEGGPALYQDYFNDEGNRFSHKSLAPVATFALRWGFSSPQLGFLATGALTLRATSYLNEGPLKSDFAVLLETLL